MRDGAVAGGSGVTRNAAAAESYPQQAPEMSGKDKKKKKFPAKCEIQ